VMQVLGDPNTTRFEVSLCVGEIHSGENDLKTPGPVDIVLVNDFVVPHFSQSSDKNALAWEWVSLGNRSGHVNKGVIYDGRGDCYGSIPTIVVVVPRKVQDSNAIPNVRVLLNGPKLRQWHSNDPDDFDREFTTTHAWVMADILTWSSLSAADLGLDSFRKAAEVDEESITYTDLTGQEQTHPRFQVGMALRERRSLAEVVN